MTRLEFVARSMWRSTQRATGRYEHWDDLPRETRSFWIGEARDMLKELAKDPGHDITAVICKPMQNRSAVLETWFDLMGAIIRQDDRTETDERF